MSSGLTPYFILDELQEVLEDCIKDLRYKDYKGDQVSITVYQQNIPIKEDDDPDEPYPYMVVKLVEGENSPDDESARIHIWIIIGIYDDDIRNRGEKAVMVMIQRVIERLSKINVLPHFRLSGKIKWSLQDTDTYPYFFGGMEMDFEGHTVQHMNSLEGIYT